ncbi:rhodopsin-like [Oscarella lobularis]|uniref:rhodopsin-like n=1 Tax=Oscarella lobularis TaxID=121494 RepID=UPI003313E8B0
MNNNSTGPEDVSNAFVPLYGKSWEYFLNRGFTCLCTTTATVLCTLVLAVALFRPKSRTTTNIFIFNLATVTTFQGLTGFSFTVMSLVQTIADSTVSYGTCATLVFIALYATAVTMWASAATSVDRCDVLTRPLARWLNRTKAWIVIAFTWILPLGLTLPTAIGSWVEIEYRAEDGGLSCYLNPLTSYQFVLFWTVTGVITPTIIIVGCFCGIAWAVWDKAKARRHYMDKVSEGGGTFNRIEAQALKITFVVIGVNVLLVTPFVIVLLLKLDVRKNALPQIVTGILLNVAIVINAVLFAFGVRSIRKEVRVLCRCRRLIRSEESNVSMKTVFTSRGSTSSAP